MITGLVETGFVSGSLKPLSKLEGKLGLVTLGSGSGIPVLEPVSASK